jgi:hypothetical protein
LEEEACKDIVNNAWETAVGLKQGVAGALRESEMHQQSSNLLAMSKTVLELRICLIAVP